jgi:NADH:ubiquinone oxidoreductase subunit 3 (subunit A)
MRELRKFIHEKDLIYSSENVAREKRFTELDIQYPFTLLIFIFSSVDIIQKILDMLKA